MDKRDICVVSARSDAAIAERLAESIRRYRLPSGITVSPDNTDYRRIFMDTQETALDEQVRRQLDESRFLIFLCSPDAKNSMELNRRLDAFFSAHPRENMIAVLVRGEPEESFPESFKERKMVRHILPDQRVVERMETIEPIAADLRADTEKRKKQLLRYETVRIIASVLSLHPDDLEQRKRAQERKTRVRILCVAAAAVLVISGIFLRLGLVAKREGNIAEKQTQLSVDTAQRTIKELPEMFADEPLALGYLDEAVRNAAESLQELGLEELLDGAESGEAP